MTQTKRQCGTCIWWGTDVFYVPPKSETEWRQCNFPVPVWLSTGWSSPHHAGGDCQTWESSVQANTNDA